MIWNISAECVSVIILCIIWVYSHKGNPLPSLQNKFFQICFIITFSAIMSNILATILLYNFKIFPLWLTWGVNLLYFILTPLMGVFYFNYLIAYVFEKPRKIYRILVWTSLPAAAYILLVLLTPLNGLIFTLSPATGYAQGPGILITYIVFYLYCFACPFVVLWKGRRLDAPIRRILVSFPIIAGLVIIVQQFFPQYILSGSAATCALLIIYLYLQNKQISIDHLTNLPNRQELLKMLEFKIGHQKDAVFAIVVISMRNFKMVNDKFGQENGNAFLQAVAAYLSSIAGKCPVYRFGGDEFAILVDPMDASRITTIFEKLNQRMEEPFEVRGCSGLLSYAMGVVKYPFSAQTLEELIDGLEMTVSQAKRNAPTYASFCTPEMFNTLKRKNQITELLKDRLEANSFELYYQPILSLDTLMFDKAEALLRLNNSPIGPVYPSEFIPIAEDTGLIIEITYQILEKVCQFVKKLMDEGTPIVSISVNFSSIQFVQANLSSRVFEIIEAAGIPYSKIKIEITESALMENFETVIDFINTIHSKGVRFALDDFGIGYSNLSTVLGFPINTIKLDKSLVWSAVESPRSELVVRHIVAAFKGLGIDILAEGVENEEQQLFVKDCGCDMVQGFLYAKPMPEAGALEYLGKSLAKSPCMRIE